MTNCKAETNIYDALLSAKVNNITITQSLLNPGRRSIISIEATKFQSPIAMAYLFCLLPFLSHSGSQTAP